MSRKSPRASENPLSKLSTALPISRNPIGASTLALTFAGIAVLKLALLMAYGPIFTPDTGGYVGYAEAMRASRAWMSDAGLSQGAVPIFAIRMIGYPAMIAAGMAIVGDAWPYVIILTQFALSLVTGFALYRLALEVGFAPLVALIAVVAGMLSLPLTYDQTILTDSFYTSFIVLAVVALTHGAVTRQRLSWQQTALAGLLFVLAFLLRDSMQVLILALVPLIALRVWLHGREQWRWSLLCCVLIVAPLFVVAESYKGWNAYRTGERFATTVAQITVMHGLAKIAPTDPGLFAGTTPLDRVGARLFRVDPFGEVSAANHELFKEGYKATDIARMAFAHYFRSWRERPATMLRLFKRNTSERVAKLTVRPIGTICETREFANGAPTCYDYRDLYRAIPTGFAGLPWSAPLFFAAQTVELTISIAIFALFFLVVPVIVLRRAVGKDGGLDELTLTFAAFWTVYVAWYVAHGIVHVEDRYMAPVLPLSLLAGLFAGKELLAWWRGRQAQHR
jgi:4-amino-4-deoxy-L-arabinose transferase-like glycosyltransferase